MFGSSGQVTSLFCVFFEAVFFSFEWSQGSIMVVVWVPYRFAGLLFKVQVDYAIWVLSDLDKFYGSIYHLECNFYAVGPWMV